jgi:hypothetical protein
LPSCALKTTEKGKMLLSDSKIFKIYEKNTEIPNNTELL